MKIATFIISQQNARIALPINHNIEFLTPTDILYCHAEGNNTILHLTQDKKCTATGNLGSVAKKLEPYGFVIIHKSYLVNLHVIRFCQKPPPTVILDDDKHTVLTIARRRKPALMKALFPTNTTT